jgi:hypothetical protein
MVQEKEHKFARKLREKQELADAGDAAAAKYLGSQAAQGLRDYLHPHPITGAGGVPESRGGGLGAVQVNDPVLSAGSQAAQLARENLLYQPGGKRRGNLTAEDIKGINIPLVRQGLSGDDYFRFNQMLYSPNIEEYRKARPLASGDLLGSLASGIGPLRWLNTGAEWLKDKAVDVGYSILDAPSDFMNSSMVEGISDTWKDRKKGRGIKGLVEDTLNMVGIGNTKKANEFITKKTENNNEKEEYDFLGDFIETDIENIKSDKKKVIKLHELSDLKNRRDELFNKIQSGQGYDDILKEYDNLQNRIWELEQGKLQNLKEGGIATLATGGFLEDQHRQPTNPLLQPTNMGGGFGNQFEDITNKLTSMEEGISTLNNRMALPQQGQNPWMLGRYG